MTSEMAQIKLSYEELNMTPQEIAMDRELEIEVVKAALMSCSSRYRKDCGMEAQEKDDLNFSDEQLRRVDERIFQIAIGSENEAIALKASMYIRDDKKGRRDIVKAMAGVTFNVLQFNEQMKLADKAITKALGMQELNEPKKINGQSE
jgi:hypothetical protein